jgi:hypothetical protein
MERLEHHRIERVEDVPVVYFDTNIILDIIDNRRKSSLDLFAFMIQNDFCVYDSERMDNGDLHIRKG